MDFYQVFTFALLVLSVNCEKLPNGEAYKNLKIRIESIRKSCGDICNTSVKGSPGKYFLFIHKKIKST